jgi:shikimate 5-dehydrogenase
VRMRVTPTPANSGTDSKAVSKQRGPLNFVARQQVDCMSRARANDSGRCKLGKAGLPISFPHKHTALGPYEDITDAASHMQVLNTVQWLESLKCLALAD